VEYRAARIRPCSGDVADLRRSLCVVGTRTVVDHGA
jgi:hypothetical protein